MASCSSCGGSGNISSQHTVYDPYLRKDKTVTHTVRCSSCGGSGRVNEEVVNTPQPKKRDED